MSLEPGGDFHRSANLLVDDLVFPCRRSRNDLDGVELFESFDNGRGVFAAENNHFGGFFLGLADQGDGQRAKADAQYGKEQERHEYRGDEGAAVAERFGELLAIDDAYVAQGHISWPPPRRSGARRL